MLNRAREHSFRHERIIELVRGLHCHCDHRFGIGSLDLLAKTGV